MFPARKTVQHPGGLIYKISELPTSLHGYYVTSFKWLPIITK